MAGRGYRKHKARKRPKTFAQWLSSQPPDVQQAVMGDAVTQCAAHDLVRHLRGRRGWFPRFTERWAEN